MTEQKKYKTAMVFGVFDGFHEGHKYFLNKAAQQAEKLVVAVTLSEVSHAIKKRMPKQDFETRVQKIKSFNSDFIVVGGDKEHGTWNILKEHKPDIVFLGYDQQGISEEMKKIGLPFEYIDAHYPEKFKSGLL